MKNSFLIIFFLFTAKISTANFIDTLVIPNAEVLVKLGLKNNSNLKISKLKISQSSYDYKASNYFKTPQISGTFSSEDNLKLPTTAVPGALVGQPGKFINVSFGKPFTNSIGISAVQSVMDWQRIFQSKIANQNTQLLKAQEEQTIQNLKLQILQTYYAIITSYSAIKISKKDLQLSDSIVKIIEYKFNSGIIDESSFNLAKVNSNNIKQNIIQSTILLNQSIAYLKNLIDLPVSTDLQFILPEQLIVLNKKPLQEIGSNKSLLPLLQLVKIDSLQIKEAKARYFPKFNLLGYKGYDQFRDNLGIDFSKGSWNDYSFISLMATLPIYSGFLNKNKVKSMMYKKEVSKEQLRYATQQSMLNDQNLLENYQSTVELIEISKDNFELLNKITTANFEKYINGLISLDLYFKSFEDYLKSENIYLNLVSNLQIINSNFEARN
ncbi:MAG: TolC family protein [Chitinophagia bacterium]|nr:TolC family protein [Chitinophagia bacterium]